MEKLAYYWKRLRKNLLAYNLVLIGAIILAMAVAAHIVMSPYHAESSPRYIRTSGRII